MPIKYGVNAEGFRRKPVRAILADIEASQRAEISPALDLSSATPWGQNNGIFANELGIGWEILEVCYHAFDPDAAQDFLMTSLAKLAGTERRAAGYSLVYMTVELDEGVTLEEGIHYAAVDGNATSLWTPVRSFTAPSTGTHAGVLFRAENPGPVPAQPTTITVINTVIPGWHSVTNPAGAELGRVVDSDETLRARREAQLTATGSSTVAAIRSDVLEVPEIETCRVFENDTDDVVDGMPPHSLEVLVFDGETGAADADAVAQAIWDNKPAGIQTLGNLVGFATDEDGGTHEVRFSRPTLRPVYIEIEAVPGPHYNSAGGDAALATFLVARLKEMHGVGDDVKWRRVDSLAFKFGAPADAIEDVTDFRLGFAPSPLGTVNLSISTRELATFDVSRVLVSS